MDKLETTRTTLAPCGPPIDNLLSRFREPIDGRSRLSYTNPTRERGDFDYPELVLKAPRLRVGLVCWICPQGPRHPGLTPVRRWRSRRTVPEHLMPTASRLRWQAR